MEFKSIADLQSLIDNEIEESTELEYKSSFAIQNPKWKEELAKDVSAMANANGGKIIYGIREKEGVNGRSIPSEVIPVPYTDMSKDKLSQLLSSNITPVIEDVNISVIPYDDYGGCFVIDIPQSDTAHQNKLTHLYYIRRNATVEVMEDYQIRDVMNRSKHPVIELEFELQKTIVNITEKPLRIGLSYVQDEDKHSIEFRYKLKYQLINKGKMYAKYVNYFISLPLVLLHEKEKEHVNIDDENATFDIFGDNTVRDVTGFSGLNQAYGPVRYDPLLPGLMSGKKSVELKTDNIEDIFSLPPIVYSLMADNAPERRKVIEWKDIKLIEKTKYVTKDPNNIGFSPLSSRLLN